VLALLVVALEVETLMNLAWQMLPLLATWKSIAACVLNVTRRQAEGF
jgi:hypothetical protein